MTDSWQRGYFTDTGYTYGYYKETLPAHLAWVAFLKGQAAPTRNFRYLDLGCGQGFNLVMMAAAYPESEFVGIDFMPGHIGHARELARLAGLQNVRFMEGDFTQLCRAPDLLGPGTEGGFDYAVAHGIYTWITPEVRQALLSLASRALAPGGLFYNAYNTFPGWLAAVPFQHLTGLLAERGNGGAEAIRSALDLAGQLQTAGAQLFAQLPGLKTRLEGAGKHDPAYLVHEYANQGWAPVFVADVLKAASAVKLELLGSATLPELFDALLQAPARDILAAHPDVTMKETLRDFMIGQSFRRDVYVKGRSPAWQTDRAQQMAQHRLLAPGWTEAPAEGRDYEWNTTVGKLTGARKAYQQVMDACASGISVLELVQRFPALGRAELMQIVSLLVHGGWLYLQRVPSEQDLAVARRTNEALLDAIGRGAPYQTLLAPATGSGLPVSALDAAMLRQLRRAQGGTMSADAIAAALADELKRTGRQLTHEGKALTEPAAVLAELKARVAEFTARKSPALSALGLL